MKTVTPRTIIELCSGVRSLRSEVCREVVGGFVTHDGQHTAVTRILYADKGMATIGSITGHKDKTLILHYGHATSGDSRRRDRRVGRLCAEAMDAVWTWFLMIC